ncbi:MAG: prephenate dehydrogenase/arogenate dehydrogenase family protein [Nitrososphaerota archaeon]|nr:prephenate dehydrogenase/arogenate dehydrogenase family protein [Nitrososphaerota archaeon]
MKVAVIGAAGAMGSFFTRYFLSRGDEVLCSDIKPVKTRGATFVRSEKAAAKDADAVIVATPMKTTVRVCRGLAPHMRRGSILVDISSVKGRALPLLAEISRKNHVRLLSVHPLFGPALDRYAGMRMAVVENGRSDSNRLAKTLFPGAWLVSMNAEAHDALMAVMLSLTHIVNIAYARVVADTISPSSYSRMATPSAALQTLLAEGVLSQDPSLCAGILRANEGSKQAVKRMALELLKLNHMLEGANERAFSKEFKRLARLFSANGSSMRKVYSAYAVLAD